MKINYDKFFQQWNQMKSSTDIMNRSITDAFAGAIENGGDDPKRITYVEETQQKPEDIPEGYSESLQRLKSYQATLTPELLKKYPDAADIYNIAIKQGVADRTKTLSGITESYQLTPQESRKILGEDNYQQYISDLSKVRGHLSSNYPGFAEIAGTNEAPGAEVLYGVRTALLGQYEGERSKEQISKDISEYSRVYNRKKE